MLMIPEMTSVHPISGGNWEGVGVEPDIVVSPERALYTAHLKALENLVENTADEQEKSWFAWHLKNTRVDATAAKPSRKMLEKFAGIYGSYEIMVSEGSLCYSRGGRMKHRLVPVLETKFVLEDVDYLTIEFILERKSVTGIQVELDDGRQIEYERNK